MTIQKYTMGPGTLKLGTDPTDYDVESQCKSFKVQASEKVKTTDPQPMLSGEELTTPDVVTLEWKATGKLLQDLRTAGLVAYTWEHASEDVAFVFTPASSEDLAVSGTLRLVPMSVGGDAGSQPDDDVSWSIVGTPTLTATP
jgi:hypothetical protein